MLVIVILVSTDLIVLNIKMVCDIINDKNKMNNSTELSSIKLTLYVMFCFMFHTPLPFYLIHEPDGVIFMFRIGSQLFEK